jgi:hypothetical protein
MIVVVLLIGTAVAVYCACRYLTRTAQATCPRGGTHRTITPAGDVAPCCVACGRMTKGGAR